LRPAPTTSSPGSRADLLRGDESNQRPGIAGYTVAGLRGTLHYRRHGVEFRIDNLFDRRYATFGIEAQNSLGPYGSATPPANPPVAPFLTPSFPRRFSVTRSARI
jgi:hypothetical protein